MFKLMTMISFDTINSTYSKTGMKAVAVNLDHVQQAYRVETTKNENVVALMFAGRDAPDYFLGKPEDFASP